MLKAHFEKIQALVIKKIQQMSFATSSFVIRSGEFNEIWQEAEKELGQYKYNRDKNLFFKENEELLLYNYYNKEKKVGFIQFCYEEWYDEYLMHGDI